jgi:hypothetical protein
MPLRHSQRHAGGWGSGNERLGGAAGPELAFTKLSFPMVSAERIF